MEDSIKVSELFAPQRYVECFGNILSGKCRRKMSSTFARNILKAHFIGECILPNQSWCVGYESKLMICISLPEKNKKKSKCMRYEVSGFPCWFDILGQYNLAPAVLSTIYFTIFPRDMWEDIFWWRQKNILYKKIFGLEKWFLGLSLPN